MTRMTALLLLMIISTPSYGFLSLMDTGNLVNEGEYRIQGEGQILMDPPEGFNLNARFATGLDDESEIQFEGGIGSVDYYLGAFYKWMPFPDTDDQPAIGGRGGVVFADFNGFSTYGFNVTPLISKNISSGYGQFTPYGGIEMSLLNNVDDTNFSMQAVIGLSWSPNEWEFPGLKKFNFMVEYGAEIDDAFNYFSFGANYNF
ncbi:MAG: hypothetical protein AAF203_09175 [Pseudomonadota bacterium]